MTTAIWPNERLVDRAVELVRAVAGQAERAHAADDADDLVPRLAVIPALASRTGWRRIA